jgi:superfamily II DNA or RNA helicase
MILRPYQEKFNNRLISLLKKFRKVVGQLATGGGKTVCFASISDRYIKKSNKRVLILVHRKELLAQTRKTAYEAFGLVCEPIVAGMKFIPEADIYVGMVETTWRRLLKLKNIGLVIIDECHRLEFAKFHDHFTDQYIIGFSATPLTANKKKPLKAFFDEIVCGIDIPHLIADGHLCQNITWAPKDVVERKKLEVISRTGDFDERQMAQEFSRPKYIHNTLVAYEKWCEGEKTLIFNVNVDHSLAVTKEFEDAGYNVKHLDGETPAHERTRILHWFKTTEDAILCNVGIATTGFDEPTVRNIIVNRATMSMPLWIQMGGRGSRPSKGKSMFRIIDMGANAVTHGDWCAVRDWKDIFHNPPKPGQETAAPSKSCPQCEAIIPAGARVCKFCGYVYPEKEVALEDELGDFVILTKNIDVQEIIRQSKNYAEYYPFFKIGTDLAEHAKSTIPKMSDDYANFILQKYHKLAADWLHSVKGSRKPYGNWHKVRAEQHLFSELKKQFPKWETQLVKPDKRSHLAETVSYAPVNNFENIKNLEKLKNIHYEL